MPEITLKLLPVRDQHDRPVEIRLRQALKFLLRTCGFRCVECQTQTSGSPASTTDTDASNPANSDG